MEKEIICLKVSEKLKLIRIEYGYTQDKMAEIIGLSKKTLIQVEKGRITLNWTTAVALSALFRESEILQDLFGGEPLGLLETIAHEKVVRKKTWGGKVWWKEIETKGPYRIQQNYLSKHYRILDSNDIRWFSSFDKKEVFNRLSELAREK